MHMYMHTRTRAHGVLISVSEYVAIYVMSCHVMFQFQRCDVSMILLIDVVLIPSYALFVVVRVIIHLNRDNERDETTAQHTRTVTRDMSSQHHTVMSKQIILSPRSEAT